MIKFDTGQDPHGLYAEIRIQPPIQDVTEAYLSEKGAGQILRPQVSSANATLIEGFVPLDETETPEDRRRAIIGAV